MLTFDLKNNNMASKTFPMIQVVCIAQKKHMITILNMEWQFVFFQVLILGNEAYC